MKKEIINSYIFLKHLIIRYKWLLIITASSFFFGFISAFITPSELKLKTFIGVSDMVAKFSQENHKLFYEIFFQNLRTDIITLISGIFVIVPLFIIFFNGSLLGVVSDFSFRISQLGNFYLTFSVFLAAILPHGIIEIPTQILAGFLSFLSGIKIISKKDIDSTESRRGFLFKIFKIYIFIIIPLVLIAAFLESFITPQAIKIVEKATFNQEKESTLLNSFILQTADFEKLGINAKPEKVDGLNQVKNNPITLKQTATYIYNDDIFSALKSIKPEQTISRFYKIDKDSNFIIQISKYQSEKKAKEEISLTKKVLNLIAKEEENVKISELGNNMYTFASDNRMILLKTETIKNYYFSLSYKGKSFEIFNELIALQSKKIKDGIKQSLEN